MAQHYFTTNYQNRELVISMGWDKSHQAFFMYLQQAGQDEPLWFNFDQNIFPRTLTPFLEVLHEFGLTIPAKMIIAIEQDKLDDNGDEHVFHYH